MTRLQVAHLEKLVPRASRASVRADVLESRHNKVANHRHCGRSAESSTGNCRNGHVPEQDLDDFKESFLKTPIWLVARSKRFS
jgi:hypothetical protein